MEHYLKRASQGWRLRTAPPHHRTTAARRRHGSGSSGSTSHVRLRRYSSQARSSPAHRPTPPPKPRAPGEPISAKSRKQNVVAVVVSHRDRGQAEGYVYERLVSSTRGAPKYPLQPQIDQARSRISNCNESSATMDRSRSTGPCGGGRFCCYASVSMSGMLYAQY